MVVQKYSLHGTVTGSDVALTDGIAPNIGNGCRSGELINCFAEICSTYSRHLNVAARRSEFHVLQYDEYVDEEKKKIFPSTSNGEYTAILYVKYIADTNSPP
ncbi:uncharacterized protein LOC119656211 [Hermetia illucens]|uniref:uncharacterized protein LOC119656211 n=1 Tax=Hermetia illucens TaxID=343691 RepID=UPI0018CC467A|nr:uncharacterized protein LOC119656211 [Hermetia illucens]